MENTSLREVVDEATGISNKVIIDWRQQPGGADLKPRVTLLDDKGEVQVLGNGLEARYFLPVNAVMSVQDGQEVHAGDVLARIPRESSKTKDITGGLPRVAELFEARMPKDYAVMAEIDGTIEFGRDYKTKRKIIIRPDNTELKEAQYMVPKDRHLIVHEGDHIRAGDLLMEGTPVPQDILRIKGVEALAEYLVKEVQAVYRLQGVQTNDKHIEVVLRQMLQKVEVTDPGETTLLEGKMIDAEEFKEVNAIAEAEGYKPAQAQPVLQGITKASLQTRSFISAASFQETTRVLTEASLTGKKDKLVGMKENVIVGRLVPAGTGAYRDAIRHEVQSEDNIRFEAESKIREAEEAARLAETATEEGGEEDSPTDAAAS